MVEVSEIIVSRIEALEARVARLERGVAPRAMTARAGQAHDQVSEFLAVCVEGETRAAQLYAEYQSWAILSGRRPVTMTMFGRRMRALGMGSMSRGGCREYSVKWERG